MSLLSNFQLTEHAVCYHHILIRNGTFKEKNTYVFVHPVRPVKRNLQSGRNSYHLLLSILRLLLHIKINQDIIIWSCSRTNFTSQTQMCEQCHITFFSLNKIECDSRCPTRIRILILLIFGPPLTFSRFL